MRSRRESSVSVPAAGEDQHAVRLFRATLFIPWLSLTYGTDHITPIPPGRAVHRLTGRM